MKAHCENTCAPDKLAVLERLSHRVVNSENEFEAALIKQLEHIRLSEGLSIDDYCRLLDISKSLYYRIINGSRKMQLSILLKVCRLFNYDLSTLLGEAYLDSADSVFRETALLLGRLSPETISSIRTTIDSSNNEDEATKKRAEILLNSMEAIVKKGDFTSFRFFSGDFKGEK